MKSLGDIHNELTTASAYHTNEISLLAIEAVKNMEAITNNQSFIMKQLQEIKDTLKPEAPSMDRPTKKLA